MSVYVDLKAENINSEEDFRRSNERGLSENERAERYQQNVEESNQLNLQEHISFDLLQTVN